VVPGIPSLTAAPDGPNTRPLVSRGTNSISSFSRAASFLENSNRCFRPLSEGRRESQLSSMEKWVDSNNVGILDTSLPTKCTKYWHSPRRPQSDKSQAFHFQSVVMVPVRCVFGRRRALFLDAAATGGHDTNRRVRSARTICIYARPEAELPAHIRREDDQA
jgi:hypothetical protein